MDFLDATAAIFDDDHRATDATAVRGDVDGLLLLVRVDADKLGDLARATEEAELRDEAWPGAGEAEDVSVEVDYEVAFGVDLGPVEHVDICMRSV